MTTKDIIIVLDESGSMHSMGNEPIQSLNRFLQTQKDTTDTKITIWTFNDTVKLVVNEVSLNSDYVFSEYNPCGMTALYDAICKAVNWKLSSDRNKNVICVIITDGFENSSVENNLTSAKSVISKARNEHNWTFIFMGANQDSFQESQTLGTGDICFDFDSTPEGLSQVCDRMSNVVTLIRSNKE